MNTNFHRPFLQNLGVALSGAYLFLLCGCGSGLGFSSPANPASPPTSTASSAASGPQLGYFWNAADATLRPIFGIPGASQIGASVVAAGTYVNGAASSASGIAVLQETDGSLDVMALPLGQPTHVATATATGAQIRFSPSGKSAIVFAPGSTSITLLTGLTSAPIASSIASPSAIQEAVLGDSGNVAVAAAGSAGANIQIVGANGAATTVGSVGALGGLAFGSGDSVVFADASANTLTLIRNASTKPSQTLVPTSALLMTPSGVGVSPNGQWVLVANSGDSSSVRVDLTAQNAPLRIACSCTPSLVVPVSGQATFRVTAPGSGPIWAVDAAVSTPRSFFIPALPGTGVHP
jgi:hypothetical protein